MTEADILSYLYALELKPATRNRHLALIKAVFTGYTHGIHQPLSGALYQSAA